MARVTVEDCVIKIPNRFELVMFAAQRARNLGAGAPLSVDRDNDKNPVVALREIADGTVDYRELENNLVRSMQKIVEADEPDGDELDVQILSGEISMERGEALEEAELQEDSLSIEEDSDGGDELTEENLFESISLEEDE